MFSNLLALFLAAASVAPYHAPVPEPCRVVNRTGVQCVWASLETLGRRDGVAPLSAITSERGGPAEPAEVEAVLRSRQVPFTMVQPGNLEATFAFLEKHVAGAKRPCAIGVYSGQHCLLCVHFERGKKVVTLGNSRVAGGIREWGWQEFLGVMQPDGWAFCLTGGSAATPKGADDTPTPRVVMPNVTVERDGKTVQVYRHDRPEGVRYVLPANASPELIAECVRRLDPEVYGPPDWTMPVPR